MGRYQSGQLGQTVNLLALRLRRFESFSAHIFMAIINSDKIGLGLAKMLTIAFLALIIVLIVLAVL